MVFGYYKVIYIINMIMDRKVLIKWKTISLVVPEKDDIELYYLGMNNIEIQHYLWYDARTFSVENEEDFLKTINKDEKSQMFWIMVNDSKKVIWNIGLNKIDHVNKFGMVGVVIFEQSGRGKWYGDEAMKLLHDFSKKHLNLRKLCLVVFWDNTRAIKLYSRIGYTEVGRWKEHKFYNGNYVDKVMMELFL